VTVTGDDGSLGALIASARAASPGVDLSRGLSLIPVTALAGAALDLRLPLIVTRGGAPASPLPGRAGDGIALLMRLYGATHAVTLLPGGSTRPLGECSADEGLEWTAILVPPLAPLDALASPWAMPWLSARLRAPDGCPWDREQTHLTLAKHLIEESWELHDAIEAHAANPGEKADAAMAEELGDVLLQVILHTQLASERGAFDLTDVQERLARKIIRRHPHVFGAGTAETSREVQRTWEAIKAEERAERARDEVESGATVGEKLTEELGELREALATAGDPDSITGRPASGAAALAAAQDELGDVIAVLVNLGRRSGIDAEAALRGANDKFRRRFSEVERRAAARGIALKSADFATLDALWDEAKAVERSQS